MTCVRLYGMQDVKFLPLSNSLEGSNFSPKNIPSEILREILSHLDVLSKCHVSITSKMFRCLVMSLGPNVNLLNLAVRLTDILIAAGFHVDVAPKGTELSIQNELEKQRLNLMQEWFDALGRISTIRDSLLDKSFDILTKKWPWNRFNPFFASLGYSIFKDNDYSGWEIYSNKSALDNVADNYYNKKKFLKSAFYYEVAAKGF